MVMLHLPQAPVIQLRTLGWTTLAAQGWNLRRAVNVRWTFYCNDQAGGVLNPERDPLPMPPGRVILVPAGCYYDARCLAPLRHHYGYFEAHGLPARWRGGPFVLGPDPADALFLETDRTAPARTLAATLLTMSARLALGLAEALRAQDGSDDAALAEIRPSLDLIAARYAEPLESAALARACGLSPSTFLRRFQALMGMAPVQLLRRRRAEAAAHLLATTDRDLEDIARACGFTQGTYFSRVFRQILGDTPGRYRALHRASQQCARTPAAIR